MERELLIKGFKEAVMEMREHHPNGTYHWYLDTDENNNDWAIVLGWSEGFETDETDDCVYENYRLCAKLAYQPRKCLTQFDYDFDWTMPYDEETGDVDDTELSIYPNTDLEDIVDWLLKCYERYS